MILDAELMFANAQAVTASAASTNILDLKAVRDMGVGQDIYVVALVTTTLSDVGADSTVTVTLETDDNEAFSSPSTARQTLGTFPASAVAGSRLVAKLQPLAIQERYMRGYFTVAGGNLTSGNISLFLTLNAELFRVYPSNQPILG